MTAFFSPTTVPDGFFVCLTGKGGDPCLVKVYSVDDTRHVGFGAWDGGGCIPIADMHEDAVFMPVSINPMFNFDFEPGVSLL